MDEPNYNDVFLEDEVWTPEDIYSRFDSGMLMSSIGIELGIGGNTVARYIRRRESPGVSKILKSRLKRQEYGKHNSTWREAPEKKIGGQ